MTRPTWTQILTRARKFGVALLGVAAAAAAAGLLPAPYDQYAPVVVALAVAIGVYRVPNVGVIPTDQLDDARRLAYSRGRLDQITGAPHPDEHRAGTAHGTALAWEQAQRRTEQDRP